MTAAARRRIGIPPDLAARPLFSSLHEPEFDVVRGVPGALGVKLRERQLDGAFLCPIDAARSHQGIRPAGGAALVARAGSNTASLLFREGVRNVRTVSADPGRISEIVLAHIVLVEQYGITPRIVPRTGDASGADFAGCDAALLAGDDAAGGRAAAGGLDLVEEWADITDLPFVHGLWYVREGEFDGPGDAWLFACPDGAALTPSLSCRFDENARDGAAEFVRMAYYHGILKEIPELSTFLPGGE